MCFLQVYSSEVEKVVLGLFSISQNFVNASEIFTSSWLKDELN